MLPTASGDVKAGPNAVTAAVVAEPKRRETSFTRSSRGATGGATAAKKRRLAGLFESCTAHAFRKAGIRRADSCRGIPRLTAGAHP